MRIRYRAHSRRSTRNGFNLIELLLVVTVISVLVVMSLPTLNGALRSSYLTTSGLGLLNQIALARQTAVSRNLPVEIRLYKLPDSNAAATTGTPDTWWAYQLFLVESSGSTPLAPVEYLQKSVVITPATDKSSLLADAGNATSTHKETVPLDSDPRVGPYNKNYRYVAFRISPAGTADVTSAKSFVTLVLKNDKTLEQGGNFFTIQIDPITASARSFRP